jgi:transposase
MLSPFFCPFDRTFGIGVKRTRPFFQEYQNRICPVFLPTYSPRLNIIERLWRQMRADITRNHFYESIKGACEAVVQWLENLSFSKFMSLMSLNIEEAIS